MTATLQDIARQAGVSIATVSRALHGTYPVAQETQERIRTAMRALDYAPNEMARRFLEYQEAPGEQTGNVGLVMGGYFQKFSDSFWSVVLDGVYDELRRQHYHLRFTFTAEELASERYKRQATPGNIDGLLFIGMGKPPSIPNITRAVAIECDWSIPLEVDNVMVEKRRAMHAMVDHLYSLGRRHLRFLTGSLAGERAAGFIEALHKHQATIDEQTCIRTGWSTDATYPIVLALLQSEGRAIDALVCASDLIAIGAMRAANTCGLRVPEDIAITGYDDIPFARDLDPPLTTVSVPKELLGRLAVRKLIERIREPDLPPIIQIVPTTLVIRASCGQPAPDR